jgi:aconitate hydratase
MNSFNTRASIKVGNEEYDYHALDSLMAKSDLQKLPYSIKILLENLLRMEGDGNVSEQDIEDLIQWNQFGNRKKEITFVPSRILMQDFTGVPAVVDLAAMREAIEALGGDPKKINPMSRTDLVIDHSVMVDHFGSSRALEKNAELEYLRNQERYSFLRWGQQAFDNFRVVPPATGIVHQVNLEFLADVVCAQKQDGVKWLYPDTLVGTDSHTTMVNGLGVLGWGVGGIEAEAAMLGQPITMVVPEVVGFRLEGKLCEGVTATDLVLTIVDILRQRGVVGKFVEFFGNGLDQLSTADQATIANMAPEYGATCGMFPIDISTLDYLRLTGRSRASVEVVESYARKQCLFRSPESPQSNFSEEIDLELDTIKPSIAGPKRPQDRILVSNAKLVIREARISARAGKPIVKSQPVSLENNQFELEDGAVVIAAITSCTNTSNPNAMVAAGLLAVNAVARGLSVKPWVKTSLAPGSQVVTEYLKDAGLLTSLETMGFSVVGYGCTTCIGNSGPLEDELSLAIKNGELLVCSVLSGNRNFEGRVHPEVQMNFLASPPLVVAYAIAGNMDIDLSQEPLGTDPGGEPVYLRDLWPKNEDIQLMVDKTVTREKFTDKYSDVFQGDDRWSRIKIHESNIFSWDVESTYVRRPPYFDGVTPSLPELRQIKNARPLAVLGDSITTDHISPAGSIRFDSPAGKYLSNLGVLPKDFNSYGSRRGNHEVMVRGTFANLRLKNEMIESAEGGWTRFQPDGQRMTIYEAAMRYAVDSVPLIVIAGKEYGAGSSRDWAAKGPYLLGVRAVLAESFERIHRQNLVGMGILPLQFHADESRSTHGLTGLEVFDLIGLEIGITELKVKVTSEDLGSRELNARVRIDTPKEWEYFRHGGILPYVLRQLLKN